MDKSRSSAEKRALWALRRQYKDSSNRQQNLSRPFPKPSLKLPHQQSQKIGTPPRQKRKRWFWRIFLLIFIAVLCCFGAFGYNIISAGDNISLAERSIIGQLKDLLFNQNKILKGEANNRINTLIIAIGGEGHKGENLADTILVASLKPQTQKAALLSIPRDLYVQVPNEQYFSKINAVHAYGESKKKDNGPELMKQIVEEVTGLPIHYYVRTDFKAFKNIVDAVGGVNITVENSFYDYWHQISFPAGTEKMNGERALAYVRARYVEGSEGGDFKRAERQQQILLALRDKVFSVQTALDFTKITSIINSLSSDIRTDMHLWEMKRFYELGRQTDTSNIKTTVLASGTKGVLAGETEMLGGAPASVLKPRTDDYSEIHEIARNIFATPNSKESPATAQSDKPMKETDKPKKTKTPQPSPSPPPPAKKPTIEVRNSTSITGLAKRTAQKLEKKDYEIIGIKNSTVRNLAQTTIYLSSPDFAGSTPNITSLVPASVENALPENEPATSADLLIILGTDTNDSDNE